MAYVLFMAFILQMEIIISYSLLLTETVESEHRFWVGNSGGADDVVEFVTSGALGLSER